MVDTATGEAVTTMRVLNVPSYTNEADFNSWFLFAQGFEVATLAASRANSSSQTGWVKFASVDAVEMAIQVLNGRQLSYCPEGTTLRAEWANKNYKPTNPMKKRRHPDEDLYSGGYSAVPNSMSYMQQGYLAGATTSVGQHWGPQASPLGKSAAMSSFIGVGAADSGPISSTLYIGKLSSDVSEQDFQQLFSICEGFERLKYVGPSEGKSGMCFAKFISPEYANKAKAHVSSYALPSDPASPLQVAFAKNDLDQPSGRGASATVPSQPMTSFNGGFVDYGSSFVSQHAVHADVPAGGEHDTMFIGNMAASITELELVNALDHLQGYVRVKFVGEGTQRPMAFVLFDSVNSCRAGIASLHGNALPSAPTQAILCQFAKNSLDKPTPKYMRQA